MTKISLLDKSIIEKRIKRKSSIIPNGCWLFLGAINNGGYGKIRINNKTFDVHRLAAYLFLNFDLHSNLQINHKRECPNKNCWNPDHLYIGTQSDNMCDKWSKKK